MYEAGAPHVSPGVWALAQERSIPILGVCYGAQEIAFAHGGVVERTDKREYGFAKLRVGNSTGILEDVADESQVGRFERRERENRVTRGFFVRVSVCRFGCHTRTRWCRCRRGTAA